MEIHAVAYSGIWNMVFGTGPIIKGILLILLFFSIVSWAIILQKVRLLRKIERETDAFYNIYYSNTDQKKTYMSAKGFKQAPPARVFIRAFQAFSNEFQKIGDGEGSETLKRTEKEQLVFRTGRIEANRISRGVHFLATTANATPFIGLFGTVWGIMDSFRTIGFKGTANLAIVAPGISEALIATAMGLAAAIPAVIAYNYLSTGIDRVTAETDEFISDLLGIYADNESVHEQGQHSA